MRQEKLLVNVEIVGVNRHTETDPMANSAFTSGTVLPWLQDTTQANVWTRWNIAYRDIVILDSSNYVSGVINLTYNDLALSANRDRLKEMLRRAVNGGDNDADKLPDHWEYRFFGDLNALPGQDSDGDGYDNSLELAFGANPKDPVSFPRVTLGFSNTKQFRVSFNRWAGSALDYLVESSTNLLAWSGSTANIRSTTTNYFDGTGRSRTTYNLVRPSTNQPSGFVRINGRAKP